MTDEYWKKLFYKYQNMADDEFEALVNEVSTLADIPLMQELEEHLNNSNVRKEFNNP